jgi:hypothetical protein
MDARDDRQFLIEHTGEGEKIVALILQRDTHGTDALPVLRLAAGQLVDDEIKQHLTRGQNRTRHSRIILATAACQLGERRRFLRSCRLTANSFSKTI